MGQILERLQAFGEFEVLMIVYRNCNYEYEMWLYIIADVFSRYMSLYFHVDNTFWGQSYTRGTSGEVQF